MLLNLSEDHLDRHGDFDVYRAAKLRIFANQDERDVAVTPCRLEVAVPGRGRRVGLRRRAAHSSARAAHSPGTESR